MTPRIQKWVLPFCLLGFLMLTYQMWIETYKTQDAGYQKIEMEQHISIPPLNKSDLDPGGRNVFLVETVENDDPLGIVCWCSLESAAVFNPSHKVFLITLHKSTLPRTAKLSKMLETYPNIVIRHLHDFKERLKGLPVETLWERNKEFEQGANYFEQISDVVRVYLLYTYGGMYLDIDAVSLGVIPDKISEKSKFPTNFGVAIFYGNVNNAVMKFQKGHPFLMEYMELMVTHQKNEDRQALGPQLFKKTYFQYCKNSLLLAGSLKRLCDGWKPKRTHVTCKPKKEPNDTSFDEVSALNMAYAYGVEWVNWQRPWAKFNVKDLLDPKKAQSVMEKYAREGALWVHLYNSETHGWFDNLLGTDTAARRIFTKGCPVTLL